MEQVMIEIKITRKNRREPTLILQSANDVTNKIVKEIEKRDTDFIWYFIQFLASTELNPGIKRFSRDQGSGFATILDQVSKFYGQNVRSVGKIYTSLRPCCITKQCKIRYVSRKCKIIFEYV